MIPSLTGAEGRRLRLFLLILVACSVGLIYGVVVCQLNDHEDANNNEKREKAKPCDYGTHIIGNPNVRQDDPAVLNYLREFYLTPPSTKPYALTLPEKQDPSEYRNEIMRIFGNKKSPGFFIEAGANDGEFLSNTLQLEREFHWSGLLIEPNIYMLTRLWLKYRKAWIAGVCLSLVGYPQKVRFMHVLGNDGRQSLGMIQRTADILAPQQDEQWEYHYAGPADCFPLYSILLALNQTVVDYFSLDVEGMELRVLKAIPFELVQIKVLSIEFIHIPEGEQVLLEFLEEKGYRIVAKKLAEVFAVHKNFLHEFGLTPQ